MLNKISEARSHFYNVDRQTEVWGCRAHEQQNGVQEPQGESQSRVLDTMAIMFSTHFVERESLSCLALRSG